MSMFNTFSKNDIVLFSFDRIFFLPGGLMIAVLLWLYLCLQDMMIYMTVYI